MIHVSQYVLWTHKILDDNHAFLRIGIHFGCPQTPFFFHLHHVFAALYAWHALWIVRINLVAAKSGQINESLIPFNNTHAGKDQATSQNYLIFPTNGSQTKELLLYHPIDRLPERGALCILSSKLIRTDGRLWPWRLLAPLVTSTYGCRVFLCFLVLVG